MEMVYRHGVREAKADAFCTLEQPRPWKKRFIMSQENQNQNYQVAPQVLENAFDVDFARRLEDTFTDAHPVVGSVVKGVVVAKDSEMVTLDIGLKTEGRIYLREFEDHETGEVNVNVGDVVDVFVDNLDDRHNNSRLSREKARREEVLDSLEKVHAAGDMVKGVIFGRVKGGFMVDVQGVLGFLPGSQLDAKPITDVNPFMYVPLEFQIVKLDRKRNNLIVSRRALTDGMNAGNREELLQGMTEGKVVKGIVKNITDYGAFLDLGGLDGLLHITDIAWHRIGHPAEVLTVGQEIDVMVVRYDEKSQRVSLGLKQLKNDPWTSVENDYPIGAKVTGKITNVADYGAFVALAPGVEGLIHVSEMSWTRKNVHPGKVVQMGQDVEVMVLEIDRDKRRISLGLKQCQDNPWDVFSATYKVGDHVEGSVRSMTDFGMFVALSEDIDGLVHVSDISWDKNGEEALQDFKKGDVVKAVILAIDPSKERVSLGMKQLEGDRLADTADAHKKGEVVKVKVLRAETDGIVVDFEGNEIFIKARDLGVEKADQDPKRYKADTEIEAKVTGLSKKDRKLNLSIRAMQQDEERAAVAAYSNQDDDGDSALAEALKRAGMATEAAATAKAAKAKKADDAEEKPAKKAAAPKAKAKKDEAEGDEAKKPAAKKAKAAKDAE